MTIRVLAVLWLASSVAARTAMAAPPENAAQHIRLGTLDDKNISESSGLAASQTYAGLFWTHNDSGDVPRLFLIDSTGRTVSTAKIRGANAVDWEDVCSFEIEKRRFVVVGDVGDNSKRRNSTDSPCRLYVIAEPTSIPEAQAEIAVHRTIEFTYATGPCDCESIAFDPLDKSILLVSRDFNLRDCRLYRLPFDSDITTAVARPLCHLNLPLISAMDVSADGLRMVIATPAYGVLIDRKRGEDWATACRRPHRILQLPPRQQGEAVCFGRGEKTAIFLTSERRKQPFWRMDLTQ